jgi:hypothetical protein
MFLTIGTIVFGIETTVCVTKTLFSEAETILCASETDFSITEKTVGSSPTMAVQASKEKNWLLVNGDLLFFLNSKSPF